MVRTTFLLECLECDKRTQMKAYDITKPTVELKAATLYSTEISCTLLVLVVVVIHRKHKDLHTVKVIYLMRTVGRRQVSVRFRK